MDKHNQRAITHQAINPLPPSADNDIAAKKAVTDFFLQISCLTRGSQKEGLGVEEV